MADRYSNIDRVQALYEEAFLAGSAVSPHDLYRTEPDTRSAHPHALIYLLDDAKLWFRSAEYAASASNRGDQLAMIRGFEAGALVSFDRIYGAKK